ncbi:MAG: ComEC/Rec2 family competence protein, partial [Planctomycetota bacterium]
EGDARRLLAERGVAFVIDVKTTENLVLVRPAPQFRPATWFFRVRRAAARRLASALPEDMAPLATALLLGLRAGIAPEERIRFERTGTMHVLAISGMHVLLLAGAVHALLRSFGVTARTAAGFTLLLALLYVPVAGGAPPIRRAVTVLTFYGLALVRGRPPDAASALGGAALLLALWRPEDVSRLGFRLSFAAAAGIFWLAPAWNERWGRRHRLLRRFPAVREDRPFRLRFEAFLLQALPVSLAAWLATQGLVAAALGVLTPLAPLTNLLVAPLLTLLLPAIVVMALGVESAVAPAALLIDALRALLDAASAIPGGFVVVSPWPAAAVACWCAGVFSLRHNAARGAVLLSLALLAAGAASRPTRPSLVLLDVGDGQAALVRLDNGNAVLVDGGSRGRPRLWRKVLRSALREEGVSRLEAVVCTHADADHWNALPELLATLPVGRLIVGGKVPPQLRSAAAAYGVPLVAPPAGSAIAAGEWSSLRRLAGDREAAGSDNDRALVLVLEAGAHRVLLPADREEAGLRRLLAIDPGRCDVLVAPHHGARCEVAPEFGAHVLPRYLLVSAGPNFSHGATLQAYGAERILKTWRNGALSVRFPTPRTMVVAAFRD